ASRTRPTRRGLEPRVAVLLAIRVTPRRDRRHHARGDGPGEIGTEGERRSVGARTGEHGGDAIAETDLTIGIDGSDAEWRPGCPSLDAGQCRLAARSEPESRKGDTALGCRMRTAGVANDSAAASHPGLALDHTGFIHFHSSTTSGSACLMSFRILLRVSPRQSPSSAILCEISCDADWPWLAPDFFMFSSSRGLNAELLCVLRVQSLPSAELHRLGTNDAADGGSAEQVIQNIEANVPPGSTHRDEAAIDIGPQRQARAATNGFELPPHIEATPVVLQHLGSVGSRHGCFGNVR